MRNPIRLAVIVLFFSVCLTTRAQQVFVAGVKQVANCEFATRPLLADLRQLRYPREWEIVVACNRLVWEQLQRNGDAMQTHTAFTNIERHLTVLNGEIYRETLPLRRIGHRTPELVLQHELGHIVCGCSDEAQADHFGGHQYLRREVSIDLQENKQRSRR